MCKENSNPERNLQTYLDATFPNNGKITRVEDEPFRLVIIDEELDPISCEFNNDNSVVLRTEGYEYLTLSEHNLRNLLSAIEKTKELYELDED